MASHPSQLSVLSQGGVSKLREGQILQTLPSEPHLEQSSLAMVRDFTSPDLHLEEHEDSFVYPRSSASANQHHNSYQQPQRTSLSEIDPYPYAADSPQYIPSLHPSQPQYHLRPGVDSYPVASRDVNRPQLSPATITSPTLDLAVQIPLSVANTGYAALRRYHETQTRQHTQALQQLTQSSTGRLHTANTNSSKDAFPSSYELNVAPIDDTGQYQATCSIPMGNNRLQQQRPPKHTSLDPYSQHQYPDNNDLHIRYPQKNSSDDFDDFGIPDTHVFTAQSIHVYDETEQEPASAYHVSSTTIHAPVLPTNTATTVSLHSTVEVLRSGVFSNTVHSLSQPDLEFRVAADATKVSHSSASLPNLAALAASYVDTRNDQYPTEALESQIKNGIKEPERVESESMAGERRRGAHRNSIELVNGYTNKNISKGQDGKRARTPEKPKIEEDSTDNLEPSDELPPAKKKKKSKMHECQVCHKQFPRPSGLKTHMNTHNNERPFPCHFPGCNRTFGVRSNAKRHLRTHGVIPSQNTGPQPYVVDFSTPMVLDQNPRPSNSDSADQSMGSGDLDRTENSAARRGRAGRGRGRQFKLRWMPQSSSASRAHATKGKGKKKAVDSKTGSDPDLPNRNHIHGQGEDYDGEDSDAQTDDGDMDLDNDLDEQDDENFEGDDDINNRTEGEEIGRSIIEMQANQSSSSDSSQRSQASSPRNSFSSSSGLDSSSASAKSTSTTVSSIVPSELTSNFTFSPWPQSLSTISLPDELKVGHYDFSITTGSGIRNQLSFLVEG